MSRDDSTSTSLLRRAIDRQPDAWKNLVKIYTPLVRHWCRQAGIGDADVADISQEVFAAISTSLPRFRADHPGTSFRAWMRGIARNKLCDHRAARREPAFGGTEAQQRLQQIPSPAPALDSGLELSEPPAELSAVYRRALKLIQTEFAETTWKAFWRVAIDDVPTDEVARELGLTPNTVRQHKSRVLRRLKEEMGEVIA
ncbi:MAG: sigma-70 family RNA polymerase sigma factor [Isosphaeraceae bacterium]